VPGLSRTPQSDPQDPAAKLRAAVLGSGSQGNCVVVESGEDRILLDAGFSCRQLEKRLRRVGVRPDSLRAIVLTHEHTDHCCGAEVLARRHDLPIYGTRGTLEGCRFRDPRSLRLVPIAAGVRFAAAGFEVEAFAVPHDAREPVGLVVEDSGSRRLALISDLGELLPPFAGCLRGVHVLVQETNHDVDMLRRGPYPWSLKQRVASGHGHLSNQQAADGVARLVGDELQWMVLYHLSRTNNLPALAADKIGEELERMGSSARLMVASQSEPSSWLEVST